VRIPAVTPRSFSFCNEHFALKINPRNGLIDYFGLPGSKKTLAKAGAMAPAYWADLDHSWT